MTPLEWMLGNDTGISSKTICRVMTGSKSPSDESPFDNEPPSDADDFGRCYRLLRHFPEWLPRLPEVPKRYPKWGPMIAAWDELCGMYLKVSDNGRYVYDKDKAVSRAMYHRMRQLNDEGLLAAGWVRDGAGWKRGKAQIISLGEGVSAKFAV